MRPVRRRAASAPGMPGSRGQREGDENTACMATYEFSLLQYGVLDAAGLDELAAGHSGGARCADTPDAQVFRDPVQQLW